MNEKIRFFILLTLFIASLALLYILNSNLGQQILVHAS